MEHTFSLIKPQFSKLLPQRLRTPKAPEGYQVGPYLEAHDRFVMLPEDSSPGSLEELVSHRRSKTSARESAESAAFAVNRIDLNAKRILKNDNGPLDRNKEKGVVAIDKGNTAAVLANDGSFSLQQSSSEYLLNDSTRYTDRFAHRSSGQGDTTEYISEVKRKTTNGHKIAHASRSLEVSVDSTNGTLTVLEHRDQSTEFQRRY